MALSGLAALFDTLYRATSLCLSLYPIPLPLPHVADAADGGGVFIICRRRSQRRLRRRRLINASGGHALKVDSASELELELQVARQVWQAAGSEHS